MSIIKQLTEAVQSATEALYGSVAPVEQIQLQKCKREFEGHLTLVAFPLLKLSRKNPEHKHAPSSPYRARHGL